MVTPVFYTRPEPPGETLTVAPALASWDKADSPSQVRLSTFVDHVHVTVAPRLASVPGPLALRLDIGLPSAVPLLSGNDLDNYLFPLVPRLTERTGRVYASVWATKRPAGCSTVFVGAATPGADPGGTYAFDVCTSASASTTAFKEQIREQITGARPLPGQGVALQLAFAVGPRRAWPNLWKATIDALGSILGHDQGAGQWNPRDGRVTDLGLHCVVDPALANRVTIAIRASQARSDSGVPTLT